MTRILTVNPTTFTPASLADAVELLRAGQLVAIPTETVYGLAALATDPDAVARIFTAKGRPSTNPIIVHVGDTATARDWVTTWPRLAEELSAAYWPGPLTIVLPRQRWVPTIITAGGPTVALRCPKHPIARALTRMVGPLAAPSANRSTELSPTRAEHVLQSLTGRIALILDGGPCEAGIESTVVDLSSDPPRLLRPGPISHAELEARFGQPFLIGPAASATIAASPGLMAKHYSPRTPLELCEDEPAAHERLRLLRDQGIHAALVPLLPTNPTDYGQHLYSTLHTADHAGHARLLLVQPPNHPEWHAIRDRLKRATS